MTRAPGCCSIVELREYTMQPGARQVFADMFDREFVETQEECGIHVIGQFLDVDRPDRFVWMRGFPDMGARRESLTAFYNGPVWAEHRDAANATMIDSDNVLLLRPVDGLGFAHPSSASPTRRGFYLVTITPRAVNLAVPDPVAVLVSEHAENSYPRLPIRVGEDVRVTVARADSLDLDTAVTGAAMRLAPTPRSGLA